MAENEKFTFRRLKIFLFRLHEIPRNPTIRAVFESNRFTYVVSCFQISVPYNYDVETYINESRK